MTSSTTRAFMAKKPFATASAFMAKTNQLLSTMASLRLFLVMFLTLTVTTNAWADQITFTPSSDKGSISTNGTTQNGDQVEKSGFTIKSSNGVMGNGSNYRVYTDGELSITSTAGNITSISFTFSSDGYKGGLNASYTGLNTKSWSAEASSQTRITKIIITYTPTVPHTVIFNSGAGECAVESLTEISGGVGINLPEATLSSPCTEEGWEFAGWKELSAQQETNTDIIEELHSVGDKYYPDDDCTLYAVYRLLNSSVSKSTKYTLNGNWTTDNGNWDIVSGSLSTTLATGKYGINSGATSATSPRSYTEISSVTIAGTKSSSGTGTVEIYYGKGDNWTSLGSKSFSTSLTWNINTPVDGKIKILLTRTAGNLYLASITVQAKNNSYTYNSNPECAPSCTTPTVSWTTAPSSGNVGEIKTAIANTNYPAGLTYSSSDPSVATIDASGVIEFLKVSSTTITASVTGDGTTYCNETVSVSKTITVTCGSKVTINATNDGYGTITAIPTSIETCSDNDEDRKITITLNPNQHYSSNTPVISGIANATITGSGNTYTVQLPKSSNGTLNISASFKEDDKHIVTWSADGHSIKTEEVYVNEQVSVVPTISDIPEENRCGDKFVGWTTAPIATPQDNAPAFFITIAGSPTITGDVTFYAVFADYVNE